MSSKLPHISITTDNRSQSESSDDDSNSNDMDYNHNSGGVTDVEDFDSQAEAERQTSRRSSYNGLPLPKNTNIDHTLTDVEDYNTDDDDEDEEKNKVYPELKMSLQEFLNQGLQDQVIINNEAQEKIEVRPGNFLQAQDLNGMSDYLTDCEDYNTDSEIEYGNDKSVCFDLNATVDAQGKVCITDIAKDNDDSDQYEDISVLSDISDLASALSDVTGIGLRGMSDDEILEMSGDEEICQIAYSGSSSDSEEDIDKRTGTKCLPEIDVAFIAPNGEQQKNSINNYNVNSKNFFLEIQAPNEEVLTDIERIDDSAAEEDSFDSEEEEDHPIPRAIILAPGDDGACQTDTEDILYEDLSSITFDLKPVTDGVLPPPHREVVELKEDKHGDTITNVMPMDADYRFGIYNNFKEETATDSEDYSCFEDFEPNISIAENEIVSNDFMEKEVIIANEVLKPMQSRRTDIYSNTESVTDVEEIYVAGINRRKKLKNRTLSKGKSKFLEVKICKNEAGHTDVEDMDLSDNGLHGYAKLKSTEQDQKLSTEKVTDVEDITADDVSDISEADAPQIDVNNAGLKEYYANSANIVVTLETNVKECPKHYNKSKINLNQIKDESCNQQNTDIEDIQLTSDVEEIINTQIESQCNCSSNDLKEMLNESYTVVHEKSGRSFDVEAEKLHIKGLVEIRDAHTDIEYVESDESAARGGN